MVDLPRVLWRRRARAAVVQLHAWDELRVDPERILVRSFFPHAFQFQTLTVCQTVNRDVGPFRYWTLQQLPNFLLAAPVLLLSFAASWTYYSHNFLTVLSSTLPFLPLSPPTQPHRRADPPFLSPALTPFVHLHTALTLLLLFASHVQIILRLCSSNPVVFWYAAYLVRTDVNVKEGGERAGKGEGRTKWGRWWVGYCVVWGVVSTVLWGVFLPPA